MICLDTNYLIHGLVLDTPESRQIRGWLQTNEPIAMPAVAWYEFLCGPVDDEDISLAEMILTHGILGFHGGEIVKAANLFNAVGRSRRFRFDAMIAGTAIVAGARLATRNLADFSPFVPHGLALV